MALHGRQPFSKAARRRPARSQAKTSRRGAKAQRRMNDELAAFIAPLRLCVRLVHGLFPLVAITLIGCSSQRTSPVEGVVLLDGKPLAGATVQFVPQEKGRD